LGKELLVPETLAMFENFAAEKHEGPTSLADRAAAADRYWAERLGFERDEAPLADTYQILFRHGSSRTHASLQGVNDVVEDTPKHFVVMLEPTTGNQALAGRAVVLYALALKISSATNGFPRSDEIERAMAEYNTKRWIDSEPD
jgi:hypothetical protein